jgi:hypothetical protein
MVLPGVAAAPGVSAEPGASVFVYIAPLAFGGDFAALGVLPGTIVIAAVFVIDGDLGSLGGIAAPFTFGHGI